MAVVAAEVDNLREREREILNQSAGKDLQHKRTVDKLTDQLQAREVDCSALRHMYEESKRKLDEMMELVD